MQSSTKEAAASATWRRWLSAAFYVDGRYAETRGLGCLLLLSHIIPQTLGGPLLHCWLCCLGLMPNRGEAKGYRSTIALWLCVIAALHVSRGSLVDMWADLAFLLCCEELSARDFSEKAMPLAHAAFVLRVFTQFAAVSRVEAPSFAAHGIVAAASSVAVGTNAERAASALILSAVAARPLLTRCEYLWWLYLAFGTADALTLGSSNESALWACAADACVIGFYGLFATTHAVDEELPRVYMAVCTVLCFGPMLFGAICAWQPLSLLGFLVRIAAVALISAIGIPDAPRAAH